VNVLQYRGATSRVMSRPRYCAISGTCLLANVQWNETAKSCFG
jgi:hypothetical protein